MNSIITRFNIIRIAAIWFLAIIIASILVACQLETISVTPTQLAIMPAATTSLAESSVLPSPTMKNIAAQEQPPATTTPKPTSTSRPEPSASPTATATATATPIGPCHVRFPSDDNLALVTLEYGISRDYVPQDLTDLSDHLPVTITMGFPTQVREIILDPLLKMVNDMVKEGLNPQIISGYRSYPAQAIAWQRWQDEYPERASIVSAPPGHSEHQLGTTIDFGSPELGEIVGDEEIRFHTNFYQTSEGQWLEKNAYKYGFTMSFSRNSFDLAGLFYEPWHFRYVGEEMATYLKEQDTTLIQYLLENQPTPCIP